MWLAPNVLLIVPIGSASRSKGERLVAGSKRGDDVADEVARRGGVPSAHVLRQQMLEGDEGTGVVRLLRLGQVGAAEPEQGLATGCGRSHVGRREAQHLGGGLDR